MTGQGSLTAGLRRRARQTLGRRGDNRTLPEAARAMGAVHAARETAEAMA